MENHHFSWENPLYMVIFNSYVKLPEGKTLLNYHRRGQLWAGSKAFPEPLGTPDRDTNATGPHHAFIHAMLRDFSTLPPRIRWRSPSAGGISLNIPSRNLTVNSLPWTCTCIDDLSILNMMAICHGCMIYLLFHTG